MISVSTSRWRCCEHRIAVVARLGDRGIGLGAQHHRIGAVDADQAQFAQRVGDRVRIVGHIGRQGHRRVAGALANALDAGRRIAFENRAVLGKGDLFRGVLGRLPVGIIGAAFDIVDHLAVELERHAQFDQRLDLALARRGCRPPAPRCSADARCRPPTGRCPPAPAHRPRAARPGSASRCAPPLPRSAPRPHRKSAPVRDAGYSFRGLSLREPMPSEPSRIDRVGCGGSAAGGRRRRGSDGHILEKCRGRHEEQIAGDGAAEIENAVVIAGRLARRTCFRASARWSAASGCSR